MKAIPLTLLKNFEKRLSNKKIPVKFRGEYKKWLQYYLDFCRKYNFSPTHQKSLPPFIQKLQEKKQTKDQQERASKAIGLYYRIVKTNKKTNRVKEVKSKGSKEYVLTEADGPSVNRVRNPVSAKYRKIEYGSQNSFSTSEPQRSISKVNPEIRESDQFNNSHFLKKNKEKGASWVKEYSKLENEIRVRHYSPKTLKTYRGWMRKYQAFTRSKSPELLSTDDVK